jgi:hypothetical protein
MLLARVWALVPLHTRFACACVCRAWRDAAASPEAWLTVHLRGVPHALATNALLIAAATRAGGEMQTLDLGGWPWLMRSLFDEASFVPFVAIHGAALRELHAPRSLEPDDVSTLLRNAPRLRALHTDVDCTTYAEARAMLRGEPPYNSSSLRLQHLLLSWAAPTALMADLEACPFPPTGLSVYDTAFDAPGALELLLGAARATRLRTLGLARSALPANEEACNALGRLFSAPECAVTRLRLIEMPGFLRTPDDATRLADALLGARTLSALELRTLRLWDPEPEVGGVLLDRLAVHLTLRTLILEDEDISHDAARYAGDALGDFIRNDACGLLTLDVSCCRLRRRGLRPLLWALPLARRLRVLVIEQIGPDDGPRSEAFYEHVLLPAVRANASLWRLRVPPRGHRGPLRQAIHLLKERRLAAGIDCLADAGVEFGPFTDDDELSGSDTDSTTFWDLADDSEVDLEPEEIPAVINTGPSAHPDFPLHALDFPPLQQ